jgi:WD40 repeat protein
MIDRRTLAAILALSAATCLYAQQPKPVSFITDVAPVFKENCFACHDAKKRSGKYDMTTFEKMMNGGSEGEPVVAGKLDESSLHGLMVTKDERRMPPRDKGEAVPADKAAIVAEWIKQGAKLDTGIDPKADLLKELRTRWKPPTPPAKFDKPIVVNSLAFSPDGKSIVVGGHYELTVWNAADGKLTKRVYTRAERAYAMAFLPDGKLAVAGSRPGQEGDVRVYDLSAKPVKQDAGIDILDGVNDKQVMVKQLLDADDSVLCLTVSPDGKKLAAGGCDRTIRVWDISGGVAAAKLEQSIENHADWVLGVAISADGKYLVSGSRDKTAKVWDLTAKESVMTFPDHQNTVYAVGLKADGSLGYSVGHDKQVRSWKPGGDGKQVKNSAAHGEEVFKIVVSPKAPVFATCSADKTVRVWDAEKMAQTKSLTGLTDHVFALAFSPDGSKVAGGSYAGEVAVWDVKDKNDKPVLLFNATPGLKK